MFSEIDRILFPKECLVLETEPGIQYVYPIFKNGSSSLFAEKKFKTLDLEEIAPLSVIDVFVRDPHARFLSGVQTYLKKSPPYLDRKTMLFMVERYLYLNRHFCPQIYWLLNLSRFTNSKFRLRRIEDLKNVVSRHLNKSDIDSDILEYFQDKPQVKFFNEMDEVLTVNLIDQVVTMADIIEVLKNNYGTLYDDTFSISKAIVDALP